MKTAMENLSKVGAELYAAAAQAGAAAEGGAASAGSADQPKEAKKAEKKADVVDADFEVVDDDKK
jgi:molecular chaperone DnaK